ncbi:ParB/RepB/Spo0J family partition protein [Streptomyces sp. NPDC056084]|uniref:ParB/RepB/Spo0J family partition protein n=1 Tax=unclassified Streptomyces TaxID=2593676 RepID=UPI0035D67F56
MAGMPPNLSLGDTRTLASQQRLFSQGAAELPVTDLLPSPENGRKRLRALDNLAASFDDDGVVQPLTVVTAAAYIAHYPKQREHVEKSGKPFVVIHGHRRLAAAEKKGLEKVPVALRKSVAENGSLRLSAIKENEQRLGLDPIEQGAEYQAALDELGISQRELARRLGNTSQTAMSHKIKLLKLIEPLQNAVMDQFCKSKNLPMEFGGELLVTVQDGATVLASLREDLQQEFADGKLTLEEARAIVKNTKDLAAQRRPEPAPEPTPQPPAPTENSAVPEQRGPKPGATEGPPPPEDDPVPPTPPTPPTPPAGPPPESNGDALSGAAPNSAPGQPRGESSAGDLVVIEVTTVKEIYSGLKARLSAEEFTELQELFLMD